MQPPGLPAMEKRVTLSDFKALQEALLDMRSELEESRGREKKAVEALDAMKSATASSSFPPPPPRRKTAAPAQSTTAGCSYSSYPDALNPFSPAAQASPQPSSSASTPWQQPAAADARAAAIEATIRAARWRLASDGRALMRLTFHAWRASHGQMCILRNMRLLQQQASSDAALPLALVRLLGQEQHGSSSNEEERSAAEWELMRSELSLLEQTYATGCAERDELQRRSDAGTAALREMTATAGALYGRGLCALEEQQGHATLPNRS